MDENKFKAIVEEVVNRAVEPIRKQLEDPDTGLVAINRRLDDPDAGLKRLNDRMDANTAAVMELEKTVKGYGMETCIKLMTVILEKWRKG